MVGEQRARRAQRRPVLLRAERDEQLAQPAEDVGPQRRLGLAEERRRRRRDVGAVVRRQRVVEVAGAVHCGGRGVWATDV